MSDKKISEQISNLEKIMNAEYVDALLIATDPSKKKDSMCVAVGLKRLPGNRVRVYTIQQVTCEERIFEVDRATLIDALNSI